MSTVCCYVDLRVFTEFAYESIDFVDSEDEQTCTEEYLNSFKLVCSQRIVTAQTSAESWCPGSIVPDRYYIRNINPAEGLRNGTRLSTSHLLY